MENVRQKIEKHNKTANKSIRSASYFLAITFMVILLLNLWINQAESNLSNFHSSYLNGFAKFILLSNFTMTAISLFVGYKLLKKPYPKEYEAERLKIIKKTIQQKYEIISIEFTVIALAMSNCALMYLHGGYFENFAIIKVFMELGLSIIFHKKFKKEMYLYEQAFAKE